MPSDSEVVITGIGAVTPIGVGRESFWKNLVGGTSGIVNFPAVTPGAVRASFGGLVPDFDGKNFVQPRKALKVMSRELQMGYAAAKLAMDDAGLDHSKVEPQRLGTVYGSEMFYGPPDEVADTVRAVCEGDPQARLDLSVLERLWGEKAQDHLFPLWMLKYLPNMPACHVGIAINAQGPNNTIVTEDTSGLAALIEAWTVIQRGHADVMIAGATGTRVNATRVVCVGDAEYPSRRDNLAETSRPYAMDRDGVVGAEGAAAVVLESAAHARQRGAKILARLVGWGNRLIGPAENQRGSACAVAASIRDALQRSGLGPTDLSHIDGHAMGHVQWDAAEAMGIHTVTPDTPVTASKSLYGHTGASCGMIEFAGAVLSVIHGTIPPTRNAESVGKDCPVRVVTRATPTRDRPVLKLSHTSLGHSVAVIVAPAAE